MKKRFSILIALCALVAACNDGYDLMDRQPSWLGESIYNYLSTEGNFTNVTRIIDDLGYKEVLDKTGSKTLFVANDEAYERFYKNPNNPWNVHRYEDLTMAQKKLLLYGSMINNSCQVAYLSSSEGPVEGDCMRRLSSMSAYDSVMIMHPEQMPDNPFWRYYKEEGKSFPCMMDVTVPPMIHFIESFLSAKEITNDDCDFLNNAKGDPSKMRTPGEAHVNGVLMVEQNIKCSNGFIHRMQDVMLPLSNMAEVINTLPNTTGYAKLLDRFCAPYYNETATKEYNRIYGTSYDSVFQKRYFSERSQNGRPLVLTPEEGPVNGTLKYDPGWNQFYSLMNAGTATNVALQENMGVMLVPTDEALNRYFNDGAGKTLKEYYGTWENVPDHVVSKMINVNMLNSLVNSVPSKFETVLNDANDEMGLDVNNVDSVIMTCNGAVYLTNLVYNPVAYVSVSFPALVNETMNILYWGIEQLQYDVYLNSQQSYYSFFIPTNEALLHYIDPCSFGKAETQLFQFHYDASALTEKDRVWASIWNYNDTTGVVGDSIGKASYSQITNRLQDILDTHIVIGVKDAKHVEDGNKYYKTKGGGMICVENAAKRDNGMVVSGGWQNEKADNIPVSAFYNQSLEGNGMTYILDKEPLMTSRKSVYDILCEHEEFRAFKELLEGSPFLETKHLIGTNEHACASTNISLFNTFNYTVFVPNNDSILKMQLGGTLPTWEQVEAARDLEENIEKSDSLANEINQFIKYHIQDNSLYIGAGYERGEYETSAYSIDSLTNNLSYHKLITTADNNKIIIKDDAGIMHEVDPKKTSLYNLMAREYQYNESDAAYASSLYTSSYAVVHQIDSPLQWKKK